MSITQNIRNIRTAKGVSQETMAEWLQVSRQTVSKWETGLACPSAENLTRLSQVLDVPIDALVKDDWAPPEENPLEIQVVEVPVEVPVFRPRNYHLWVLLAAMVLVAGIIIGAFLFRKPSEDVIHSTELEGEVIDVSTLNTVPLLPVI